LANPWLHSSASDGTTATALPLGVVVPVGGDKNYAAKPVYSQGLDAPAYPAGGDDSHDSSHPDGPLTPLEPSTPRNPYQTEYPADSSYLTGSTYPK
jgi:hypothetical protein